MCIIHINIFYNTLCNRCTRIFLILNGSILCFIIHCCLMLSVTTVKINLFQLSLNVRMCVYVKRSFTVDFFFFLLLHFALLFPACINAIYVHIGIDILTNLFGGKGSIKIARYTYTFI